MSVATQRWVFCQKWRLVQYLCVKGAVKPALCRSTAAPREPQQLVGLSEVWMWIPVLSGGVISTGTHSKLTLDNLGVNTDIRLRHTSSAELSLMLVPLSSALTMGAGL